MERLNRILRLPTILAVFWGLFWVLNGGDKFLNGAMEPMVEPGLEKAVLVNSDGEVVSTMYGYEVNGLFGANRNAKMTTFFERLGIGPSISLPLLYGVALFEIFLGGLFVAAVYVARRSKELSNECLDLGYKLSLILFTLFCSVDILIGERVELWEHTTFMAALLVFRWGTVRGGEERNSLATTYSTALQA